MDELIVECDTKGNIIGSIEKHEAHEGKTRLERCHFSTWCMVFNPKTQKYLLQLKNPKVKGNSSDANWDMGVAGHNNYVNDKPMLFEETLVKEADEEVGIEVKVVSTKEELVNSIDNLDSPIGFIFDKFHYKTERNNEFIGAGIILTPNEKVEFKDKEVIEAKWLTPKELEEFLKEDKNHSNALEIMFEKTEKFRKVNLVN